MEGKSPWSPFKSCNNLFLQVYSFVVILPKTPFRERISLPCEFQVSQQKTRSRVHLVPRFWCFYCNFTEFKMNWCWSALAFSFSVSLFLFFGSQEEFLWLRRHPVFTELCPGLGQRPAVCWRHRGTLVSVFVVPLFWCTVIKYSICYILTPSWCFNTLIFHCKKRILSRAMQAFYLLPSTFHFSLEKNVLFFFFNYYCFFAFNIFCLFIFLCFQPLTSQHRLDTSLKAQIMKEKKFIFSPFERIYLSN